MNFTHSEIEAKTEAAVQRETEQANFSLERLGIHRMG